MMKSAKNERGTTEEMAQMTAANGGKDDVTGLRSKSSSLGISGASRVYICIIACLALLLAVAVTAVVVVLFMRQPCDISSTAAHDNGSDVGKDAMPSGGDAAAVSSSTSLPATTAHPWLAKQVDKMLLRLPRALIPVTYNLHLDVDVHKAEFNGSVVITLRVMENTSFVILHSHGLAIRQSAVSVDNITSASPSSASGGGSRSVPIRDQKLVPVFDFYIIELTKNMQPGEMYNVSIGLFQGQLLDDMKGLYRSVYRTDTFSNRTDSKRYLVASQLQAIDARRVFPCFDEPDMKATFTVAITHTTDFHALSNMPAKSSVKVGDNKVKVDFETTPIMSTYLLAFVISDFPCRTTQAVNLTISVCSRPQVFHQTKYALNFTSKIYDFFTDYFGIREIVPKAHHVAVPDFSAGAMENWGLVLYRETSLLFDEVEGSVMTKFWVSLVMAHEIAHTWFGNMMTMKWWDDLWLNEGFGNTLMYYAIAHVYPEWNAFDLQLINNIHPVMNKDSLLSSHPVSSVINHPDDIIQSFDHISYDKGMAVLRMLYGFMVDDDFKKALRLFVRRYKMKNAEASELWATFAEVVNGSLDIAGIMNSWTKQTGLPVITIRELSPGLYHVDQQRFLLNPEDKFNESTSPYGYKWYVPLSYRTQSDKATKLVWMNFSSVQIRAPPGQWILGNVGRYGFFRMNYDDNMWQQLANQLLSDHLVFSTADRAGLISDAFSLARANKLGYDVALKIASYMAKETEFVPWESFFDSMDYIQSMLSETDSYGLLKKYVTQLTLPQYRRLSDRWWLESDMLERCLKKATLKEVVSLEVCDAVNWMKSMFLSWKVNGTKIQSDIAAIVYAVGVREGNEDDWEYVLQQSRATRVVSDAEVMMAALCYTRHTWLLWRFARWSLDGNVIRTQDIRNHFRYLTATSLSRLVSFQFLLTNWQELNSRFGTSSFLLSDIIQFTGTQLNTEFEYEQLRRLYDEQPPAGVATKAVEGSLAVIRTNINWMKTHYSVIEKWLQANVRPSG